MTAPDGTPRHYVQNITAVNGFAYGAIGADIHVHGNGLPLYLLANWQAESAADPQWLRALPSRMLNARRAVVPFTGRERELAQLHQWRDSGPRLAVRWLHGPGGQGKTRLAARLAATSAAAGWKVIAAFHGPDADPIAPGSQDLDPTGATGLLVVVDYADRWLLTNMTWLLKNPLLQGTALPTRILMVGRTANSWPGIQGILDTHQADTSLQLLPPLAPGTAERTGFFTAARDSFAAVHGLAGAPGVSAIRPPAPLDTAEFGLTLAVHMAALVAVDTFAGGERAPQDLAGLTMYLLNREQLHWGRLYRDGMNRAQEEDTYGTAPQVMNQTVFTAVLTGSLPGTDGTAVLDRLRIARPRKVLADHASCYPPAGPAGATVLEPLYPDRLAEDFLALTLPGHGADYPAQPWAVPTATTLLARHAGRGTPAGWTPRALTFLAAAAGPGRWDHVAAHLNTILRADPQLAVDAGTAALLALADAPGVDLATLEAVEARFPDGRHTDLDVGIAGVVSRLTPHRLATAPDAVTRAHILEHLADRLFFAGLTDQALTAAQEALPTWRDGCRSDPQTYEPALARALANLGTMLSEAGRHQEALAAVEEAVALQRRLTGTDPAHTPALASSLANLGTRLAMTGRHEDGLAAALEAAALYKPLAEDDPDTHADSYGLLAVNISLLAAGAGRQEAVLGLAEAAASLYRKLARTNPAAHLPDLANALSSLGSALSRAGRPTEALAAAHETVAIRRRLATTGPAAHTPPLAAALSDLGVLLSGAGRPTEALAPAQEAAALYRMLAGTGPATHLPALARALSNLSGLLTALGRRTEAATAAHEAVTIRRRLAAAEPAAHTPGLATALHSLSVCLAMTGRTKEALDTALESTTLLWGLAQANRAHTPDLANALNTLAAQAAAAGSPDEALSAVREAVTLYRRLVRDDAAHTPGLARALTHLSQLMARTGRREEALPPAEEAVALHRQLAAAEPAAHTPALARSLVHLGALLTALGRQAQEPTQESAQLYRQLAAADPGAYEAAYAEALTALGAVLALRRRRSAALQVAREAVDVQRRLAGAHFTRHGPGLTNALTDLGLRLLKAGHRQEALPPLREAVSIERRLAEADPLTHTPDLARALTNLGLFLLETGHRQEALAPAGEAVALHRRLAAADPPAHGPGLTHALEAFSSRVGHRRSRWWRLTIP